MMTGAGTPMRSILYVIPLYFWISGAFLCVSPFIDMDGTKHRIAKTGQHAERESSGGDIEDVLAALTGAALAPMAQIVTSVFAEALQFAILYIGGLISLLTGFSIACFCKKAPARLRRLGILLNGLSLLIAAAVAAYAYSR
jgi:ABC-type spermidine/putrescine transport system permease subunit I